LEFVESILSDPNYSKLASCPFMLSMIASVVDSPVGATAIIPTFAKVESITAPKGGMKRRRTTKKMLEKAAKDEEEVSEQTSARARSARG